MARTTLQTLIILLTITLTISNMASSSNDDQYYKSLNPKELGIHKKEKLTHIHFYFHDVTAGQNITAMRIAGPEKFEFNSSNFGLLSMMDDPLTVGPELSSKRIGSAQGLYGVASQTELALLMVFNYVFTDGKFKGSTLSILGRNAIASEVREMPIVGGTGVFRFSRGFVQARTYKPNATSLNAVVEHNVYVFHYLP